MNTLKHISITLVIVLAGVPLAASAQSRGDDSRPHERLQRQHQRIEQGVDSGVLTRREAKVLRRETHDIRYLTHAFRADGKLSGKEQRILARKLDRNSRLIHRLKHNDRQRHDPYTQSNHEWDHDGLAMEWRIETRPWREGKY